MRGEVLVIPEGFLLGLLVFTLFIIFSVSQIRQGKKEINNPEISQWKGKLRIVFATILLIWFFFLTIILLSFILNFLSQT